VVVTPKQREVAFRVTDAHVKGQWYRACSSGERVTLASLFRAGVLERRVWRTGKNSADNAHEYRVKIYRVEGVKA
jgi:hypothetical protein